MLGYRLKHYEIANGARNLTFESRIWNVKGIVLGVSFVKIEHLLKPSDGW